MFWKISAHKIYYLQLNGMNNHDFERDKIYSWIVSASYSTLKMPSSIFKVYSYEFMYYDVREIEHCSHIYIEEKLVRLSQKNLICEESVMPWLVIDMLKNMVWIKRWSVYFDNQIHCQAKNWTSFINDKNVLHTPPLFVWSQVFKSIFL